MPFWNYSVDGRMENEWTDRQTDGLTSKRKISSIFTRLLFLAVSILSVVASDRKYNRDLLHISACFSSCVSLLVYVLVVLIVFKVNIIKSREEWCDEQTNSCSKAAMCLSHLSKSHDIQQWNNNFSNPRFVEPPYNSRQKWFPCSRFSLCRYATLFFYKNV